MSCEFGWYAVEKNVKLALGNTFLELGVNLAIAIPEVEWLEYSYQNLDHLVNASFEIRDGFISAFDEPGHGLTLSETARKQWRQPAPLPRPDDRKARNQPYAELGPNDTFRTAPLGR